MKKRILVVDDDRAVRLLVKAILAAKGYSIELASSAEEALELCAKDEFDLVLTDRDMKKMNGCELARNLNLRLGEGCPPVMLMTGRSDFSKEEAGPFIREVLHKPFSLESLENAVSNHLALPSLTS